MTPQDRKSYGASLRQARRRRVHDIRRRVMAGATALFVAVWLLIAVMLVSGHDPALARKTSTTTTAASTNTSSGVSTKSGAGSGATNSGTSSLTSSQS